jgi:predicted methyltransferase
MEQSEMTTNRARLVMALAALLPLAPSWAGEPEKPAPKPSAAEHAKHGEVVAQEALDLKASEAHAAAQHGKEGKPPGGHQHGTKHEGHPAGGEMHHDFSDAERWAKVFDDPARAAWQKPQEVVDLMEIEPGMQVADIGAGTGYFLGYLAAAVGEQGRVLGLDPEQNLVDYMNKRAEQAGWKRVRAKKIPYDSPGLPDRSTDRILIVDTWHHIENRVEYAKQLAAALAEGGAVYVVDFTMESPVGPKQDHRLEANTVINELKDGGLAPTLLEESLPNQYVVMAKKPGCDCGPTDQEE